MITVFGASGTVGREVVAGLVAAGSKVRAVTRRPDGAVATTADEVGFADLTRPETLPAVLAEASAVFVATAPDALQHEPALAAAVRAVGVPRVVKVSSVAAMPPVADSYGAAHASAEESFRSCGAEFAAIRPATFMSNVLQWRPAIAVGGPVHQPYGSIGRALIDPRDIAAVAVALLTASGPVAGVYQVTGPERLTAPDVVARVAAVLGRPLAFADADPAAARAGMLGAGMPAGLVDGLLASMSDPDPRRGGTPLPTVRDVLGRPPATLDDWLRRHRADLLG
jgi:uncharacterized protein YbjT (DUF2867 family)